MNKPILIFFAVLFLLLQYELWISPRGVAQAWNLHNNIAVMKTKNAQMAERNAILYADVNDLKHGRTAIEERARNDLGMVERGEVYYQVVK